MLTTLDVDLAMCLADENVFGIMLECLHITSHEEITAFPIMSRFLCNFLKHLKVRIFLDLEIPFKIEEFDLLCEKIRELTENINKKSVQSVAAWVQKFLSNKTEGAEHQREIILLTFIKFLRDYEKIPSRTASEKVVVFYSLKYEFKEHMEVLLDHAMSVNVFDQVIAFATLNLANINEVNEFRSFIQGIENYLTRRFENDLKQKLIKIANIASVVLTRLPSNIENFKSENGEDRLMSLDFVLIMVENLGDLKKKVCDCIPAKLEDCELNEKEKEHLESFKAALLK